MSFLVEWQLEIGMGTRMTRPSAVVVSLSEVSTHNYPEPAVVLLIFYHVRMYSHTSSESIIAD